MNLKIAGSTQIKPFEISLTEYKYRDIDIQNKIHRGLKF